MGIGDGCGSRARRLAVGVALLTVNALPLAGCAPASGSEDGLAAEDADGWGVLGESSGRGAEARERNVASGSATGRSAPGPTGAGSTTTVLGPDDGDVAAEDVLSGFFSRRPTVDDRVSNGGSTNGGGGSGGGSGGSGGGDGGGSPSTNPPTTRTTQAPTTQTTTTTTTTTEAPTTTEPPTTSTEAPTTTVP